MPIFKLFKKPVARDSIEDIEAALVALAERRTAIREAEAEADDRRAELTLAAAGGDQAAAEALTRLGQEAFLRHQEVENIARAAAALEGDLGRARDVRFATEEAQQWLRIEAKMAEQEQVAAELIQAAQDLGAAFTRSRALQEEIHHAIPKHRRGTDHAYAPATTAESWSRVLLELAAAGFAPHGVSFPIPDTVRRWQEAGGLRAALKDHHGLYLKNRPGTPGEPPADLPDAA